MVIDGFIRVLLFCVLSLCQTMVVPEEREGKTGAAMMLSRDPSKATDAVSTRKAGAQDGQNKAPRKVLKRILLLCKSQKSQKNRYRVVLRT